MDNIQYLFINVFFSRLAHVIPEGLFHPFRLPFFAATQVLFKIESILIPDLNNNSNGKNHAISDTVFPHIVAAATILF